MLTLGPNLSATLALVSGLCFIMGLKGLAHPRTARRGNLTAMAGMALAVVTALLQPQVSSYVLILIGLAAGAVIGIPLARKIPLTALPQLVALFHSFVGLAAALVAAGMYLHHLTYGSVTAVQALEIALGAAIGLITFTGSILAALKLHGVVSGTPWGWSGRHVLNLSLVLATLACTVWFCVTGAALPFALVVVFSTILGVTLVAPIGGADMPVIVSLLNSYSGWAAAATGFMLQQPLLVLTGALIGMSGAILSFIMCKAMNRSFLSVLAGGFGAAPTEAATSATGGTVKTAGTEDAAYMLANASRVIVVPGYGMAVAQAQHALKEVFHILQAKGVEVAFAIHPVAGRMPGHMNVLLAEADIPYDNVFELENINPMFPQTDVVLVIGANDVVNPAAQNTPGSPIYGMPVLEAWKAKLVYVVKRSHRPGYAGVDNPLFSMENAALLLGDAKAVTEALAHALKDA